jgi:RNA polymerase sigma factor (sigma-70 family)
MTSIGSVSQLIADFKDGDEEALADLHRRYWPALVNMARKRLKQAPIRGADEEDVAQSALIGFCKAVQDRRTPDLVNRHQLLALLSHIVACKAVNRIKHAMTLKQGHGKVGSLTPIAFLASDSAHSPDEEVLLRDCYEKYVGELPDKLRDFAELHLAGLTNREIAERLGCIQRKVERKLALLRSRWQNLTDTELD